MEIIKDLRILKAIGKKYGIEFDKDYKYIISDIYNVPYEMEYKGEKYQYKFFSGCFCPYIIKVKEFIGIGI